MVNIKKQIIWIIAIFLIALPLVNAISTDKLIIYWKFDELSGNLTDTLGSYTLTQYGTVANQTGKINGARGDYSSSNYFNKTTSTLFDETNNITVSLWAKPITLNPTGDNILVSIGSYTTGQFSMHFYQNGNNVYTYMTNAGSGICTATTTQTLTSGAWFHFIMEFNGTHCGLRINNGSKIASAYTGGDLAKTTLLLIGERNGVSMPAENWYIDEVGIWNRSLNNTEISELYNSGNGFAYPFTGPNMLVFNGTSLPTSNYEYISNQSILFSTNATLTNNTINCSLILNSNTNFINQYSNLSGENYFFNINTTNYANYGLNNYYFSCNSIISGNTLTSTLTSFYVGGKLNITAKIYNGSTINNFNITLNGINYGTTSGVLSLGLDREQNYTLFFNTDGYEYKNTTINFNSTSYTYNFSVYFQNTINITFRDSETNGLVNNVSVELIGSTYSNNYSTSTANLFLELLSPLEYNIRYTSPQGYVRSDYIFNLINRTSNAITLYLLKNTSSTTVTATVYDENNKLIEGVYIKSLKYDLTSNSYILQEIVQTNFEGKATLDIKLNTEYYKFILEYPLGTIVETTNPSYIISNSITFQINLQTPFATEFYKTYDVNGDLAYNDATNSFRFTYSDGSNTLTQGCLRVYKLTSQTETLYNTSCALTSSGTLLVTIANASGLTYVAKAYVTFSGGENLWGTLVKTFEDANYSGKEGVFWVTILTILFMMIGAWNVTISLILAPLPLVIGSYVGLITLPFGISLLISIVCWWTAITISGK